MTLLAQRSLDEAMSVLSGRDASVSVKAVSRISSGSVAGIFGGWGAIRPAILQSGHHVYFVGFRSPVTPSFQMTGVAALEPLMSALGQKRTRLLLSELVRFWDVTGRGLVQTNHATR